ncbi:MAG TPA: hypothetical protein VMY39_00855, partial [Planctomycetota bacterium]|nr:hypothetical protein [Planctomycetota bacterium]
LLEWSMKQKEQPGEHPPTDFIVTSSEYKGTLDDKKGDFVLTMKLEVLKQKGWKRIPVLPLTVAITSTTLPKGVYLNARGNTYELLTSETGEMTVVLAFSVAVTKAAGIHRVDFQRVAPGSSVVDLTVSGTDVDVKLANAQALTTQKVQNNTHVVAALPGTTPMSIDWQRAIPEPPPVPAKLYAETQTLVAVAEGMLLCTETVEYNILHSGVRELKLKTPAGVSVMTVSGRSVQDWRVSPAGELNVVLRGEVTGPYALQVVYEQPAKDSVNIPVVRAEGVVRERGTIAVVALANVEITGGEPTGATTLDVRRLPPQLVGMTGQPILLAYRYVADTFTIPLNIRKHGELEVLVTVVDTASFTAMQLNDGRRMTRTIYKVRNNRNQFLRMRMPADAEIWSVSVSGRPASPAKDEAGNVLIPLVRSEASASELTSFPVELVYVETPKERPKASGSLHVELPTLQVPVMQVMVTCFLPAEGYYPPIVYRTAFKGSLRPVDRFAMLSTTERGQVEYYNAAAAAQQLQTQVDQRVQAQVRETGATPIRVRLPLEGKQYRFERILALPGDQLWLEMTYSNWQVGG